MPRPDIKKVSHLGVLKRKELREDRRKQVKRLLESGMTRVKIRDLLCVSQSTIIADVKSIVDKKV